ncbi:putative reverse transcriptase domain-containing protein [Tanacetum coccineum]
MPNTRSGASRTREGINKQIDRRLARALRARDATRNLEPLIGGGGEQEELNGNGGNGNGGGNGYNFGGFMPARECTYQDFLKCQPLSFNGTEGVVGLTRWFEKMETVFHISNCLEKYQVKYATCTLLNSALTWWNSHKRTIRIEAAYAMSWAKLMKLMTEELVLLCTRMVPSEEDKVERFVGGLPDNIQGNVIAAEPTKLQDAIRIANNLMDQKLKGYARSAENKRRLENNSRDNRGQQPVFKRQNIGGKNVARAYTAGNNERKGYVGPLPYYNKCRLHHEGLCTIRCRNCKKVGHLTRDCRAAVAPNTQSAAVGNQPGVICYECGRPGHFRKDCHKLRNQFRGNQTRNKNGNRTVNQTSGNEATVKAYAIRGGGTNPDSNVVTGTFLLNNGYASMLFDSGADRSFMSSTFSALIDVAPSTLDTSYAVELADGRISETDVVLRGYTLGLLGHPFDIDLMPVELGSFDVIIDMDWLAKYYALIVCDEKVARIPYGDEVLIIRGDNCDGGSKLNIISCTRTQKYIVKGCQVYLAQVTSKKDEDKSEEKRLEDVPIVREFLKVFPEDLLGLPPARQIRKEYEGHLKLILTLLKEEELYAKFSIRCEFGVEGATFFEAFVYGRLCPITYSARLEVVMIVNSLAQRSSTRQLRRSFKSRAKYMADEPLDVPLDEIQVDDKLNFIEEPVEVMDREVKRLKQSRIPIVKVSWNSRRGLEFTWEREDQMQKKYPHLFTNSAPAAEKVASPSGRISSREYRVFVFLRGVELFHVKRTKLTGVAIETIREGCQSKVALVLDFICRFKRCLKRVAVLLQSGCGNRTLGTGSIGKWVGTVLQRKTETVRCFGTSIVVEETGSKCL